MYNSQDIALRIKQLAKEKQLILKEMLECCGLSKNTLSSMLSGGSTPKSENLAKIADYLDCSVDYLLGRTDNPAINRAPEGDGNSTDNPAVNQTPIGDGNNERTDVQ